MKKISIILLVFAIMLGFYSCQKEATKVVYNPANVTSPNLSGITDGSVITFLKSQSDSIVQFTWTPAKYGFNTSVQYFVQIAKAGTNFAEPQTLGTTESVDTLKVAVSSFNNKVNTMKANAESPDPVNVEMRLIAIISPSVDTVFSQTIGFTLNTYYIPIIYPQLYVPGDYQGWAPDAADSIGSIKSNTSFEGYVYISNPGSGFKFTSQRDWNGTNYGDGGTAGTLSTDGGAGNLTVPEAGFYKFNVDTQALTWSYLKTTWSMIGDVTSGGDWSTDLPLNFDTTTDLWTVTGDFPAGAFKFRANDSWDLNYGSDANDGILQDGGGNINITAAGNYTITLDLTNTVYKYSIKKN